MNDLNEVFNFESNRFMNTKQAAHYLGLKVSYIYNLVHKGELTPYKCGKKTKGSLRFIKVDLDRFLGKGFQDGH